MEKLVIALSAIVCALAIFVLGYKLITDKIIKEQFKEIVILRTENKRLKEALTKRNPISNQQIDYPATVKIIKQQERMY